MAHKVRSLSLSRQALTRNFTAQWTAPSDASHLKSYKYRFYYYLPTTGRWYLNSEGEQTQTTLAGLSAPDEAILVKITVWAVAATNSSTKKAWWTGETNTVQSDLRTANPAAPACAISMNASGTKATVTVTKSTEGAIPGVYGIIRLYKQTTSGGSWTRVYETQRRKYASDGTISVTFDGTVVDGARYMARACSISQYGEQSAWSEYTEGVAARPKKPEGLSAKASAYSEGTADILFSWPAVPFATSYTLRTASTEERLGQVGNYDEQTGITGTSWEKLGVSPGTLYARIYAVRTEDDQTVQSVGSTAVSITVASSAESAAPYAPTVTASNPTVLGQQALFSWIHNAADESDQTQWKALLYLNGARHAAWDRNGTTATEFGISTAGLADGDRITAEVATKGAGPDWSEYGTAWASVYAEPSLSVSVAEDTVTGYPIEVALSGSSAQALLTATVELVAAEDMPMPMADGSIRYVAAGSVLAAKTVYTDGTVSFGYEDAPLPDGYGFTVRASAMFSGGMSATAEDTFSTDFEDADFEVSADIFQNADMSVTVIPTATGDADAVLLSVYRIADDGSTEAVSADLPNDGSAVLDMLAPLTAPTYRIVGRDPDAGSMAYADIIPDSWQDGLEVVLTWAVEDGMPELDADGIAGAGSVGRTLVLPFHAQVSESVSPDVADVEYIGRADPVSYHGTQLGRTCSISTEIWRDDRETLALLRELSVYRGDVCVRTPSGLRFWAHVAVSIEVGEDAAASVGISCIRVDHRGAL